MKIYTKTGDQGETGLFGAGRVSKDSPRIQAYGSVDELNALLGVVQSLTDLEEVQEDLKKIQNDLFDVGSVLATPDPKQLEKIGSFVGSEDMIFLEKKIDFLEKDLSPLKNFILPGGDEVAAQLHVARTVCRRAERDIVHLNTLEKIDSQIVVYMNRLSDFLFVLARWVNFKKGVVEPLWEKKKERRK